MYGLDLLKRYLESYRRKDAELPTYRQLLEIQNTLEGDSRSAANLAKYSLVDFEKIKELERINTELREENAVLHNHRYGKQGMENE